MVLNYERLEAKPGAFRSFTGFFVREFETLLGELMPVYEVSYRVALERADRQRAFGGGRWPHLSPRDQDQVLLTVIWLRLYPTQEVLGFLFGVSDTNVLRTLRRILPCATHPAPHPALCYAPCAASCLCSKPPGATVCVCPRRVRANAGAL